MLLALAWLAAALAAGRLAFMAWHHFDQRDRADGNRGHATIDFGGSWTMGRILVEGRGAELYDREALRQVLVASYGKEDAAKLLSWFMPGGTREGRAILGPLYPPVNAFVAAPLSLLPPQTAYRVHEIADLLLLVLTALGVTVLSSGRIWLPVAILLIALFPGFQGNVALGQNSVLSLAILVWGWVLMARRPETGDAGGGALWGLLAYKPVWAASFFLVLPLARRWRAALAMGAVGAAQIALTLPFVGVHSWLDWLAIGRQASARYALDRRWIELSRDLAGIPRRFLMDFTVPMYRRADPAADMAALALWLGVLAVTVTVALRHRGRMRAVAGPPAAFLLLGGWLVCYHFMYYDTLLAFLPVVLLFVEPGVPLRERLVPALALAALFFIENPLRYLGYGDEGQPWSTYVLLLLWGWCGWKTVRPTAYTSHGARGSSPAP